MWRIGLKVQLRDLRGFFYIGAFMLFLAAWDMVVISDTEFLTLFIVVGVAALTAAIYGSYLRWHKPQFDPRLAAVAGRLSILANQEAAVSVEPPSAPSLIVVEEHRSPPEEYSGSLTLHIPKELHSSLAEAAKENGVSLDQYLLYKLSK